MFSDLCIIYKYLVLKYNTSCLKATLVWMLLETVNELVDTLHTQTVWLLVRLYFPECKLLEQAGRIQWKPL